DRRLGARRRVCVVDRQSERRYEDARARAGRRLRRAERDLRHAGGHRTASAVDDAAARREALMHWAAAVTIVTVWTIESSVLATTPVFTPVSAPNRVIYSPDRRYCVEIQDPAGN